MKELLKRLDESQAKLATDIDLLKTKKATFETVIELDVANLKALEQEVKDLKLEIEPLALKESEKLGKKTLDSGIVIKTTKSLIYDKKDAIKYAKSKQLWLTLDTKSFEKTAKTMLDELDFVSEETTNKVAFPKSLKLNG